LPLSYPAEARRPGAALPPAPPASTPRNCKFPTSPRRLIDARRHGRCRAPGAMRASDLPASIGPRPGATESRAGAMEPGAGSMEPRTGASAPRATRPGPHPAGDAQTGLPPALLRPFRLIAFDWDGTAVVNRRADATAVRTVIDRLRRDGVLIAVITGTNFDNVARQLSSGIHGPHKRRLFILTNRGSEVWGFDEEGRRVSLWRRVATPEEERRLTAAADAVRSVLVARTGLDIRVVYDRLNRRKIDLIPLAEWADPPKSEIGALYQAVQSRLVDAGYDGGLAEAFRLAQRLSARHGLEDPRITSDVKHIEIGLTDKSDSVD